MNKNVNQQTIQLSLHEKQLVDVACSERTWIWFRVLSFSFWPQYLLDTLNNHSTPTSSSQSDSWSWKHGSLSGCAFGTLAIGLSLPFRELQLPVWTFGFRNGCCLVTNGTWTVFYLKHKLVPVLVSVSTGQNPITCISARLLCKHKRWMAFLDILENSWHFGDRLTKWKWWQLKKVKADDQGVKSFCRRACGCVCAWTLAGRVQVWQNSSE